jgi:uncharacterized membrane protein YkvA (DUF1232 family)
MKLFDQLRTWARAVKAESVALYFAARHPRTPWYAKALIAVVVAYALSPIDLIPDFIPVLGYLDDVILVPAGIALAVKLVPRDVMDECRARANEANGKPRSMAGALAIIAIWLLGLAACAWLGWRWLGRR